MIPVTTFFFVLGTAVGSFLNVLAYRSVHGGSPFFGSSACPRCKHKLEAADLIPIVSFLLLKGRCRYCHKKISWQYPLVEAATGFLFAFTFYYWWLNSPFLTLSSFLTLVYLLFIVGVLIVLFTTDIIDGLLPNSIVLPVIVIVLVYKFFLPLFPLFPLIPLIPLLPFSSFLTDLMASLLVAFVFFAIVYLSKERVLGGGDPKFAFFIALAIGWPAVLVALYLAFLTGGAVAAMLLLLGRKRFGQSLPLGPFLALGGFVALFWGQQIIDIYLRILNG